MLIQAAYDGPPYAPPTSMAAQDTATAAPVPVEALGMTLPGLNGCLGCGMPQLSGLRGTSSTGTTVLAIVAVLGIGWILYGLTRK